MPKKKGHQKQAGTSFFKMRSLLVVLLFCFVACAVFYYFKLMPPQKIPSSAVVVIPEEVFSQNDATENDAIGDFILHHEYFAADKDVLEDGFTEKEEPVTQKTELETEALHLAQSEVNQPVLVEQISTQMPDVVLPEQVVIQDSLVSEINNHEQEAELMSEEKPETLKAKPSRQILHKIESDTPLMAIVIDDMGVNQKRTKDIILLKAPLTSSFLTYGKNLAGLAHDAKQAGHEIMIHAPMEPKVKADLAPDTLMVTMDEAAIEKLFNEMLAKFENLHVSGINNHMGSRFTEDKEKLGYIMKILKEKQMFFLDSKTTASSKGRELATEDEVDFVARDVFLDNENNYNYIMGQLERAEKIAAKKGFVIAICHPKSQTYLALKDWLQGLKDKNIKLVHVSKIVKAINK